MPIPIYLDHDSEDAAVIAALRAAGIDLLTSTQVGNERAPDYRQLQFASNSGRLIYTANTKDYAKLHRDLMAAGQLHAGIAARVRQITPVGAQVAGLLYICREFSADDVRNRMFYI